MMVIKQIFSLLCQLVFWMLVFASERLLFLLYFNKQLVIDQIPLGEITLAFYKALRLDLATTAYVLILPFILSFIQFYVKQAWPVLVNKAYTAITLLLYLLISVAELGLYGEWETKLSFKALLYLKQPIEVVDSVSDILLFVGLVLLVLQFLFFFWLYRKWFFKTVNESKIIKWTIGLAYLFVGAVLLFIGMRGGVQEIPITSSQSYFSKFNILNLAAVNSGYNVFFSTIDYFQVSENNRFTTLDEDKAKSIVQNLHQIKIDTTVSILNIPKPNVVIILMESWSGDLIESLGGQAGITPEFRKLEKEGLLFTHFFATGNRSQQAVASIYAGLPALPVTTLTDHPEKYHAVPSLIQMMNASGYFTSFYFGGQLTYGNIKSFLMHNQVAQLIEGEDFDSEVPNGKMGVHDEFLFNRLANDLGEMPQPFFATALTLSSHSPYDYPQKKEITHIQNQQEFVNSVAYADQALGEFFSAIKKTKWYKNTLFFVMADHSHASYNNYPMRTFDYHQIPLLIVGGALMDDFHGKQIDGIFHNVDIPKTLLKQLALPANEFFWSRDMFNPYSPEYAFFELNNGFGWKQPLGEVVYNIKDDYFYIKPANENLKLQLDEEGKAYIQTLFQDFLEW